MFQFVQEVEVAELSQWLSAKTPKLRVVDVREPREHMQGMVPGSEPMPLASLPARLSELARDEKLVMVCHSGGRSAQACMFLRQQGYDNVFNLRGGIIGWAGSNLPIASHAPQQIA